MALDLGGGLAAAGDILGGVSNFFGDQSQAKAFGYEAQGDAAEAKAYGQAATYAEQNAQISAESTKLQQYQQERQSLQVIGAGQAAAAANGGTGGGSAQDILRGSVAQGALTKQVIGEQGIINETAYHEQAAQYTGMQNAAIAAQEAAIAQQKAAKQKSGFDLFGGILKAATAIFAL